MTFEMQPTDFEIQLELKSGGFGPPQRGIIVRHRTTGEMEMECSSRSDHRNKQIAYDRLIERLEEWQFRKNQWEVRIYNDKAFEWYGKVQTKKLTERLIDAAIAFEIQPGPAEGFYVALDASLKDHLECPFQNPPPPKPSSPS